MELHPDENPDENKKTFFVDIFEATKIQLQIS